MTREFSNAKQILFLKNNIKTVKSEIIAILKKQL